MQVNLNSANPLFLSLSLPLCDNRPAYPFPAMSLTGDNSGANFMGAQDPVKCTDHMCPIRVHWHVKTSYVDHWRIKLTITNYNYQRNFSNWNVLVQHPGLSMNPITYSFNSKLLQPSFRGTYSISYLLFNNVGST